MASSVVAELEAGLQGMLSLKPPGVSGSRITNITALCVANVQVSNDKPPTRIHATFLCGTVVVLTWPLSQYESVLIQKLFTHFKKTPGTHKLGVLYVVDSVTRKWLDQAKAQGQTPSISAPDGTFAAGVNRVTELIPILMNDIIATTPEDQKVRREHCIECHLIPRDEPAVCEASRPDDPIHGTTTRGSPRLKSLAARTMPRDLLHLRFENSYFRFHDG